MLKVNKPKKPTAKEKTRILKIQKEKVRVLNEIKAGREKALLNFSLNKKYSLSIIASKLKIDYIKEDGKSFERITFRDELIFELEIDKAGNGIQMKIYGEEE